MMIRDDLSIGVDIGGTKIASVLINRKGTVLASDYRMTEVEMGKQETIKRILESIHSVYTEEDSISGIGIDVPGLVDPREGIVENAVNLGWDRVELRKELQMALGTKVPIFLQRDTYAQALSEYYYGCARGEKNFVYLSLGSGLGAGALVDGKLLQGANRSALEVGHMVLPGLKALCSCGKTGCVETILSGPGMLRTYQDASWQAQIPSALSEKKDLTLAEISAAFTTGEERSRALFAEVSHYAAIVIAGILSVLNPSLVIIGGGTGLAIYDAIQAQMKAEIEQLTWKENVRNVRIEKSSLDSSALGAASLVWYGMTDNQEHQIFQEVN